MRKGAKRRSGLAVARFPQLGRRIAQVERAGRPLAILLRHDEEEVGAGAHARGTGLDQREHSVRELRRGEQQAPKRVLHV